MDWVLIPLEGGDDWFEGCCGCALILAALSFLSGGCAAAAGINMIRKKTHKK